MPTQVHSRSVPKQMQAVFEDVVGLTDAFCKELLNDEYAQLCRELAAALCRKRPSPLNQGKLNVWAAGIISALGSVNFLHDPSQQPHMRLSDIGAHYGVSASATAAKAKQIRHLFRMIQLDPRWCLPSKLDQNPLAWMIQVNGFIIDARHGSREIQEQAFRCGLIPYIPGSTDEQLP